MTTRTKHATDRRDMEAQIDDLTMQGYKVIEERDRAARLRKRDHGSGLMHIAWAIFAGWWTLGLANLVYALYRRRVSTEEVVVRVA